MKNLMESFDVAALAANLAEDKKAKEILVLQTEDVSYFSDYFVIATVESRTQMRALANTIAKTCQSLNIPILGQELDSRGGWSLLDLGEVVIHLFNQEERSFYQLERFWNHATQIPRTSWETIAQQAS